MKLSQKILIFMLCVLAELIGWYVLTRYAIYSNSRMWMYCVSLMIASLTTQMLVLTHGRAD